MTEFPRYECLRCNHKWYPRPSQDKVLRKPRVCPKCNSVLWDVRRPE
jgi:ribosomal protein S27AE